MTTSDQASTSVSLNVVPARTGVVWVKQGIKAFFKQPIAMGGLFFMNIALTQILGLIPVVGFILVIGLIPAFNAGMLVAAQNADQNKFSMPLILFSAFRKNSQATKSMLFLGAIYLLVATVLITIFNLIYSDPSNMPLILDGKLNEKILANSDFQTASLVVLFLQIPIGMLFWHAPALAHWRNVSPLKALFFSFYACFKNLAAMVVYFFTWLGVFIFSALVLTLLAVAVGSESAVSFLMLPAVLMLAAMFFTSIYFTYQDSFSAAKPANELI